MRCSWQELRLVCQKLGWVEARTKGDHLVMTRPGMARPVVIKMDRSLGEDIIRTNMLTMGVTRKEFEQILGEIRRAKRKRTKK